MPTSLPPAEVPLARGSATALVFRFDADNADPDARYEFLPHVRIVERQVQEGAHPGTATFRYVLDPTIEGAPTRVEQTWGLGVTGTGRLRPDDRVVVRVYPFGAEDENDYEIDFDGYVMAPHLTIEPGSETSTFDAVAAPARIWDRPIRLAIYRDATKKGDDPDDETTAFASLSVSLPARFNPEGKPNATRKDKDLFQGQADASPLFIDPLIVRTPDVRRKWSLSMAAKYIIYRHFNDPNRAEPNVPVVDLPDATVMESLLEAWEPTDKDGGFDPDDPATFKAYPIDVPDLDITGDAAPVALEKLLAPHGFLFRFALEKDEAGDPYWRLDIYRDDTGDNVKDVLLPSPVGFPALEPARTNLAGLSIERDGDLKNVVSARTGLTLVEASFVLYPLFEVAEGDAADDQAHRFIEGDEDGSFEPAKYRLWGFDETGEGHMSSGGNNWFAYIKTLPDLSNVLNGPLKTPGRENAYLVRRRPGRSALISRDPVTGEPFKSRLFISTDYFARLDKTPHEWDGKGTWQEVTGRDWELLEDRLGVRITTADPRDWHVGEPPDGAAGMPFPGGHVNAIACTAAPGRDAETKKFFLRLLTVIEADHGVGDDAKATAGRRASSSTRFRIETIDESRDRFHDEIRMGSSPYVTGFGTPNAKTREWVRDDLDGVVAQTQARRRAHELAPVSGALTIPRVSFAYQLGDRIRGVLGRNISFRENVPVNGTEPPIYPRVCGIARTYGDAQQTILHIHDRRSDPAPRRRT